VADAGGRVPLPDPPALTGAYAGPGVAKIGKKLGRSLERPRVKSFTRLRGIGILEGSRRQLTGPTCAMPWTSSCPLGR
jgi:hypothetical protein